MPHKMERNIASEISLKNRKLFMKFIFTHSSVVFLVFSLFPAIFLSAFVLIFNMFTIICYSRLLSSLYFAQFDSRDGFRFALDFNFIFSHCWRPSNSERFYFSALLAPHAIVERELEIETTSRRKENRSLTYMKDSNGHRKVKSPRYVESKSVSNAMEQLQVFRIPIRDRNGRRLFFDFKRDLGHCDETFYFEVLHNDHCRFF
jgi:hypothetical protein